MYVKKATDGKFYFLDNYMAVYYKLLNDRGGVHAVNNPIEQGYFHSFPPGFRSVKSLPGGKVGYFILQNAGWKSSGDEAPTFLHQPQVYGR